MTFTLPIVGTTVGPTWATNLNDTIGHTASQPVAADVGFLGWSIDPAYSGGGSALVAGRAEVVWLPIRQDVTVSTLYLHVLTAGAGLSSAGLAMYAATGGTLISQTTLAAAGFQSTGIKVFNLPAPIARTAGSHVLAVFWANGTTMPQLTRGGTGTGAANLSRSGGPLVRRFGQTAVSTFTTATAIGTLSTQTDSIPFWAAYS